MSIKTIAVTGSSGRVGAELVSFLLSQSPPHNVIAIDLNPPHEDFKPWPLPEGSKFVKAQLTDLKQVKEALKGADAVVQLAGFAAPASHVGLDSPEECHNTNVVISYNVMSVAASMGITRIAAASSACATGIEYSLPQPRFYEFPQDENTKPWVANEYGLTKQILELQATQLCASYPSLRIASFRFHHVCSGPSVAAAHPTNRRRTNLWGYVSFGSVNRGVLSSLLVDTEKVGWDESGHEVFCLASPRIAAGEGEKSEELRKEHWPDVKVREDWNFEDEGGRKSFWDCKKAERMLSWKHDDD